VNYTTYLYLGVTHSAFKEHSFALFELFKP